MEGLIVFLLGLAIGSFLNVAVYRLKAGKSFLKGRSYCDFCKKQINWQDNVPLLSFLVLKGKCRYCQKKIPLEYFLIELLTGLGFLGIYWFWKANYGWDLDSILLLVYWLVLFSGSLALAVYDFKTMLIADEILLPLILTAFLRLFWSNQWQILPAAFLSMGFLGLIWLVTRGKGMGFGDVKLAFLMGLVLGWPKIVVAYFLAFLTGALVGVILVLIKKMKMKGKIAFGPFLVMGMLVAKLWGDRIWSWYMGMLGL